MMVKRKLDGAVNESSEKFENLARLYINCEKSGGLYLAEPGLTAGWLAGWLAGWQTKFGRGLRF